MSGRQVKRLLALRSKSSNPTAAHADSDTDESDVIDHKKGSVFAAAALLSDSDESSLTKGSEDENLDREEEAALDEHSDEDGPRDRKDGSSNTERDGSLNTERDGSSKTERDGSSSTERDGSSSTKRDGSLNTKRDGISKTEGDGSLNTERSESSNTERDGSSKSERNGSLNTERSVHISEQFDEEQIDLNAPLDGEHSSDVSFEFGDSQPSKCGLLTTDRDAFKPSSGVGSQRVQENLPQNPQARRLAVQPRGRVIGGRHLLKKYWLLPSAVSRLSNLMSISLRPD